jgi:DNA invertase Pin-like site-specific DNA recombinase
MKATQQLKPDKAQTALIYCRVSDKKQKTDGHGLESQGQRCRQRADELGLTVEMVFTDDFTGGGDFMKRPAMRALLTYLVSEKDH